MDIDYGMSPNSDNWDGLLLLRHAYDKVQRTQI